MNTCGVVEARACNGHQKFPAIDSILFACILVLPQNWLSSQSGVPWSRRYLLKLDLLGLASEGVVISCWGGHPHKHQ